MGLKWWISSTLLAFRTPFAFSKATGPKYWDSCFPLQALWPSRNVCRKVRLERCLASWVRPSPCRTLLACRTVQQPSLPKVACQHLHCLPPRSSTWRQSTVWTTIRTCTTCGPGSFKPMVKVRISHTLRCQCALKSRSWLVTFGQCTDAPLPHSNPFYRLERLTVAKSEAPLLKTHMLLWKRKCQQTAAFIAGCCHSPRTSQLNPLLLGLLLPQNRHLLASNSKAVRQVTVLRGARVWTHWQQLRITWNWR